MKTIATINFKGGVGKTTVTWALAQVIAQDPGKHSLMFDLDAQMSLTQAVALNEDGNPFKDFSAWYERAQRKGKTIFNALDLFTQAGPFEFGINYEFIYQLSSRHHFIPSDEHLYWTELELFDREKVKFFIRRILERTQNSKNVPNYDVVLFDCPPSFSLLSYSILSCCDLVLIPINPDFFAAKGLNLLLNSLKMRIEPFPIPKIGVFMNRAKKPGGSSVKKFSNETQRYRDDASDVVASAVEENGLTAKLFKTAIFDRIGIKRAIQEGMPPQLNQQFTSLWSEIELFLNEK
jgi:chromosome partitioning protein